MELAEHIFFMKFNFYKTDFPSLLLPTRVYRATVRRTYENPLSASWPLLRGAESESWEG